MRIGRGSKTGLVADRGFLGLQLESGARITLRRVAASRWCIPHSVLIGGRACQDIHGLRSLPRTPIRGPALGQARNDNGNESSTPRAAATPLARQAVSR